MARGEPKLPVGQLTILCLCRLAEPIALTSVFPYLPEMIESFGIEKNDVAKWAGITAASFSVAQAFTGIPWGSASDMLGRKPTLLLGLSICMIATLLFGFSRTLTWAIAARVLAGASSGTIGITRTAVAEMVPWKELQPRAFSFMPIVWSIGSIVGPSFGGALASPAAKFPDVFASPFFEMFPFILPNLLAGILFFFGVALGLLYFKETLKSKQNDREYGLVLGQMLIRPFRKQKPRGKSMEDSEESPPRSPTPKPTRLEKPIRIADVFSVQSSLSLLVYTLVAFHAIAFDQLLPVFLHLEPEDPTERVLPIKFAGGFGLNSGQIGVLLTCYAVLALLLQFVVFPPVARHFGVLRCLRITSLFAPVPCLLIPFTVLFPTSISQRIAVLCVMAIKCLLCAFWFPCSIIVLTNSTPNARLLGTLNGVATSISATGRAIGPASAGALFTYGADVGYVIIPWFYLACFGALTYVATRYLVEMDGLSAEEAEDDDLIGQDGDDEQQPLLGSGQPHPTRAYSTNEQRSK